MSVNNAVDDYDFANNYLLTINKKGDAVYETSNNIGGSYSWFNDSAYMPFAGGPWFGRGGLWRSGGNAGAFQFTYEDGGPDSLDGFRPVLVVNAGL